MFKILIIALFAVAIGITPALAGGHGGHGGGGYHGGGYHGGYGHGGGYGWGVGGAILGGAIIGGAIVNANCWQNQTFIDPYGNAFVRRVWVCN